MKRFKSARQVQHFLSSHSDPRGRFMMGLAFLSLAAGVITVAVIINKSLR